MRVILDTNVLISALLFGGRLDFIVELLIKERLTLCFSGQTWSELKRVLQYPHIQKILNMQGVDEEKLLSCISTQALFFANTCASRVIPKDPDDEAVLACAETALVKAIVTGDKHIFALAKDFFISILTPQQFKSFINFHS